MGQSVSSQSNQLNQDSNQPPAQCPVHQDSINPLNKMPILPQSRLPDQKQKLPLEREISSIPKPRYESETIVEPVSACPVKHSSFTSSAPSNTVSTWMSWLGLSASTSTPPSESVVNNRATEGTQNWVYPSPQQFYHALVRKGWETPEESVVTMVEIHNWLNERAWLEIKKWEVKHPNGENSLLAKFEGKASEMSPKARWHLFMGKLFPSRYNTIVPFDRHDWVVQRPGTSRQDPPFLQRYVIDYYHLPDDDNGNPVFSLDVRPALDNWISFKLRLDEWQKTAKERWLGAQPIPQ